MFVKENLGQQVKIKIRAIIKENIIMEPKIRLNLSFKGKMNNKEKQK